MPKTYTFKCEVVDEDDEVIASGTKTMFYESVRPFGDCEPVDDEVGNVMRRFVQKVESKESLHELEAELIESNEK